MPKILRVELTSDQEREVRERLRARDLAPGTRLPLDCIRLMGRVSAAWLTELLHRDGFRWKRTRDTLRHKADPVLQQAARARLEDLRLDAHAGVRDLYFLDESGFAPTMPTGYTWSRAGLRAVVPREDKKGRRVNVLGALSVGQHADLVWERTCGKIDAVMLLKFVCTSLARLPGGAAALERPPAGFTRVRPCTVVLDNASTHVARIFKGRREELAAISVELFYLPPRSPELNDIERVWRSAKYEDYPERVHTTADTVGTAVDHALNRQRTRIKGSAANFTKAAFFSAVAALRERVRGIGGPRLVGHGHGCAVSDARRGRP